MKFRGLELRLDRDSYWPGEDTELAMDLIDIWIDENLDSIRSKLESIAEKPLKLKIVDMGAGPGTLGLYLLKRFREIDSNILPFMEVIAIDISEKAIQLVLKNAELNGLGEYITGIVSDLFSGLKDSLNNEPMNAELIIFNPPYLPSEPEIINGGNKSIKDHIWDGGRSGINLTLRFIGEMQNFIADSADLILIGSSLGDFSKALNELDKMGYRNKHIKKVHLFFEDIIGIWSRKEIL